MSDIRVAGLPAADRTSIRPGDMNLLANLHPSNADIVMCRMTISPEALPTEYTLSYLHDQPASQLRTPGVALRPGTRKGGPTHT